MSSCWRRRSIAASRGWLPARRRDARSRLAGARRNLHWSFCRRALLFRYFPVLEKSEQVLRDAPHLDFLRALGDAVAPVMAENVLERLVPRVSDRAMHLHRAVRRVADQPVRAVVAHRDLVGKLERDLRLRHLIHLPRGLLDQI